MKTIKSGSVEEASRRIAKARGLSTDDVRKAIRDAIRIGNMDGSYSFLSYPGILPVHLPDGARIVVLPDIHVPAHNKKVMWAVLEFLKEFRPDIVIFIGDVADMFGLSRWPKPPRVVANPQMELDETRRLIDKIIEVSGCLHVFVIVGNHEDRVLRYLTDPASGIANVLDFETREPVMSFHGLMGYTPDDRVTFIYDLGERGGFGGGLVVNNDWLFHHGYIVRKAPGASPRADADLTGRSTGHGHTHRAGMNARLLNGDGDSDVLVAAEFGHLADPTHAYMAYANLLNNWHHALGVGLVSGGKLDMKVLPIKAVTINGQPRYALTFAGKVFVQSDR